MSRFANLMRVLKNPKMIVVAIQGMVSGLIPTLIGGTLLQAWVTEAGLNIKVIGLLTGVATPYTIKFLWAPIVDRFKLPFGRRKGWILFLQLLLILAVLFMSGLNPAASLQKIVIAALVIAYLGATLDIVLDAWRREYLHDDDIAFGLGVNTMGYMIAFKLIGGSLALIMADHMPWGQVYRLLALFIVPAMVAIALSKEPQVEVAPPRSFYDSVAMPFAEFFSRKGSLLFIAFILLYKLGDNMGGALTTSFFLEMDYTKTEIGAASKLVGWIAIVVGSLLGGALVTTMKMRNSLFIFGILQALSTAAFAFIAIYEYSILLLTSVIAFENLTAGLGTAAYATLIARLTNKKFTATQYALLTSAMGIPRYMSGMVTGYMVAWMGWITFFITCALIAIPGMILALRVREDKSGQLTI
jgi:MFS transporter, PAT family, beta-lactamase induction signal transducer AmpG